MALAKHACPLCDSPRTAEVHRDERRRYFQCDVCALLFADPASLPTPDEERKRYDHHRNTPLDAGYRRHLGRLVTPLIARLGNARRHGLDFGSGPGPTLSVMLEEVGHTMSLYDPLYAPDASVLNRQYDFVTCTETIEHFHRPGREWRILKDLVAPGGWLAIMTRLAPGFEDFKRWWYINDATHVSFFSRKTFRYLASRDALTCEFLDDDVILLQEWQRRLDHETQSPGHRGAAPVRRRERCRPCREERSAVARTGIAPIARRRHRR